ncbi:hypothetical protein [Streptomyces sp. NBC_01216]|uniref:hypothetical protein n=1 Tax=Streptomyces sp. NBC_01216 TaxID=2903778 RepID=UPI003FA39B04
MPEPLRQPLSTALATPVGSTAALDFGSGALCVLGLRGRSGDAAGRGGLPPEAAA